MCGIVGGVSNTNVIPILIDGLERLEYRGYDSAGVAAVTPEGISCLRRLGKIEVLREALEENPMSALAGIVHTRWATHGKPSEKNAHPHVSQAAIAVVHNGIIENHVALRAVLREKAYEFSSDTDTEVIAHLVNEQWKGGGSLLSAVQNAVQELEGAYSIAVISKNDPENIVAVRMKSPLVIGIGKNGNFVASDVSALISITNQFVYLEDGDVADIYQAHFVVYDKTGKKVERPIKVSDLSPEDVSRGGFLHFMQKEIHEQPDAVSRVLDGRVKDGKVLIEEAFGNKAAKIFARTEAVQIIACGTSHYSSLVARYWMEMESLADIPCHVDVASEWRYRNPRLHSRTLYVFISQSGETADTLACLNMVKEGKPEAHTITICNVPESSMTREAELTFLTKAGAEIGVASTKAFTTQLAALMLLTLALGRTRGMTAKKEAEVIVSLLTVPEKLREALLLDGELRLLAPGFGKKEHALYLGRGSEYPIALEGSLKMKEISYIHAEGYPAGELKHGPLALVNEEMPVIAVAPNDVLVEKLQSNLKEVRARNGQLFIFASPDVKIDLDEGTTVIALPRVDELVAPIVYVVPLQLLAYHVAVARGNNVDQPRNLAKSVTVE
ncbi:MAG: glutamine--fructose-6-phosphate transaminase (isomerizing) [Candidatus Paceibacterota bacterium]|nr:glutamine--fructose-6-phosphate transaminase (isomerizing) [Candidatus Paceibacterota bacterium]